MQGGSLSIGVHSIIIRGVSIVSVLLNMYIPHYISIHHIERMYSSTRMAVTMWNFLLVHSHMMTCIVLSLHYTCTCEKFVVVTVHENNTMCVYNVSLLSL